jgi:uncharacterized membrane protein YqhA
MQSSPPEPTKTAQLSLSAERRLEAALYASRWLMAPFYLGLVLGLAALLVVFVRELLPSLRICRR